MNTPLRHKLGIFMVALAVMGQFLAPVFVGVAEAQTDTADLGATRPVARPGTPIVLPTGPSGFGSVDAAAAAATNVDTGTIQDPKVSPGSITAAGGDAGGGAGGTDVITTLNAMESKSFLTVYNLFVMLGGWIAGLGGMLFDYAIDSLVLKFGCWITTGSGGCDGRMNGEVGGVINEVWEVIRDLFNIIFIFALVLIGLRLILNADETGTRKAIGMLIAAALLVNFSLYIGKLVIDVANFTAVQIHSSMVDGLDGDGFAVTGSTTDADGKDQSFSFVATTGEYSIAGAFMQTLRISTFFSANAQVKDGVGAVLVGLLAFVFLCYLGFVLAYGAVMLVVRFIALILLLIFSPMMFLGWVLPSMEKYSSQWRTMFLAYSFFIPAYLLLLYISLYVLIQIGNVLAGDYANAIVNYGEAQNTSAWEVYLLYILGVGFLYASTKVAGAMSKSGAVIGMNAGSNLARKMTIGVGAATAGAASGWAGRGVVGGLVGKKGLEGSADWLESRVGSWQATRGLRNAGTNLQGRKYGSSYSRTDLEKAQSEGNRRAAGLKTRKEARRDLANATDPVAKQNALAQLQKSDIIEMSKTPDGAKLLTDNAHLLSTDHIKALTEDKEQDRTAVQGILKARGDKVATELKNGTKQIKDATNAELNALGFDGLKEPKYLINLKEDKIDKLDIVDAAKNELKDQRRKLIVSIVTKGENPGGVDTAKIASWSPEDISKLPDDVFKYTDYSGTEAVNVQAFIEKLSIEALRKIAQNKGGTVTSSMSSVLNNFADPSGTPKQRALAEFLLNDNVGKGFGK